MAKGVSPLGGDSRYICCDCNQIVFRRRGAQQNECAENRCDRCGHEMNAVRSTASAFGLGIGWAATALLAIGGVARIASASREVILAIGLAICGAFACNRLLEATRHFRGPEPSASISRQTLAEAAGAFLALLIGSAILLQ